MLANSLCICCQVWQEPNTRGLFDNFSETSYSFCIIYLIQNVEHMNNQSLEQRNNSIGQLKYEEGNTTIA